MSIPSGKILDSFTMQGTSRVLVVDQDYSTHLKRGDSIKVTLTTGVSVTTTIQDAILADGSSFGLAGKQVSSLRVVNEGFGIDNSAVIGGTVSAL